MPRKEPAAWVRAQKIGRRIRDVRLRAHNHGLALKLANQPEEYTDERRYDVIDQNKQLIEGARGLNVDELEQWIARQESDAL